MFCFPASFYYFFSFYSCVLFNFADTCFFLVSTFLLLFQLAFRSEKNDLIFPLDLGHPKLFEYIIPGISPNQLSVPTIIPHEADEAEAQKHEHFGEHHTALTLMPQHHTPALPHLAKKDTQHRVAVTVSITDMSIWQYVYIYFFNTVLKMLSESARQSIPSPWRWFHAIGGLHPRAPELPWCPCLAFPPWPVGSITLRTRGFFIFCY